MPNLLRNQSVIFFAIVYEISKSVIPLSNSVIINLVIGFEFLLIEEKWLETVLITKSFKFQSQKMPCLPKLLRLKLQDHDLGKNWGLTKAFYSKYPYFRHSLLEHLKFQHTLMRYLFPHPLKSPMEILFSTLLDGMSHVPSLY